MPNLIPDWLPWMRPAGRLIWAVVLTFVGLGVFFALLRRPKPDRPTTWAEAMAGATGVFAMLTLAYAVVPHEWITFSDKYLQWDTTKFLFRGGHDMWIFPWQWPFSMDYRSLSDIVTVGIYGVFFGLNLALWVLWQKRGVRAAPAEEKPRTSRFGRPLRRRAAAPAPLAGES